MKETKMMREQLREKAKRERERERASQRGKKPEPGVVSAKLTAVAQPHLASLYLHPLFGRSGGRHMKHKNKHSSLLHTHTGRIS